MRRCVVVAILLAGCGRLAFDDIGLGNGHDEDGDGIADVADLCPHLPGPQTDSDGDGVGDDCDPLPLVPTETLTLFTLQPGDQPLTLNGTGTWTQGPDSVHYDGAPSGMANYSASYQTVRIVAGIDVLAETGGDVQHHLWLSVQDTQQPAFYFVELNQGPGYAQAAVAQYDGATFSSLATQPLATRVHPGAAFLQSTVTAAASPSVRMDGGWPGEPYTATAAAPSYTGGDVARLGINSLEIELRYIVIISTAP